MGLRKTTFHLDASVSIANTVSEICAILSIFDTPAETGNSATSKSIARKNIDEAKPVASSFSIRTTDTRNQMCAKSAGELR